MAEIEISVLDRQCLDRRLEEIPIVRSEVQAWEALRNDQHATVDWRFTTTKARSKCNIFTHHNHDGGVLAWWNIFVFYPWPPTS